jgi:hypothetical protein
MHLLTENRNPEGPTVSGAPKSWRELASRRSGGIAVGLYWRPQGDEILVQVTDELTGESFVLEPPRSAALSAFYHPYALRDLEGADRWT